MQKHQIIFILIIILASLLRLWNLNNFPAGLNADEASIGYNAYSLIQTGRDEYGEILPLNFKSFGDYKPGLYFYLVAPFVAILGLNEWAVRIPSALFGIFTVIVTYFLTKEIFKDNKVALLAAFLLAISPWHLHFSRGGWETNVATLLLSWGLLLFIKGIEKPKLLFWSLLTFVASLYTYQSPRLIVPILIVSLIYLYKDKLLLIIKNLTKEKTNFVWLILLIFLILPVGLQFLSGTGSARFMGLSFLSDTGPIARLQELRGQHLDLNSFSARLLHNKLTALGPSFLGHYLDHFQPNFLFINGDPLIRNRVPEIGQFYLTLSLFLFAGLFFLIRSRIIHQGLIVAWILIGPLASAMTYQTPHALRSLNIVIPLTMIVSFGFWQFLNLFKRPIRVIFIILVSAMLIFEVIHYLESYYVHYPKRYPVAFEYGFREMVSKLGKYEQNFEQVIITDRYDQPYILVLFYKKYDPTKFQSQAVLSPRDKFNFGTVRSFDKYQFKSVKREEILSSPNTLFVVTGNDAPQNAKILDKVLFPNGEIAFLFIKGG